MKSELRKIKSHISADVWELLKTTNAIIAGGAITSTFTSRDINDFDIYFRSDEDISAFITSVFYRECEEAGYIAFSEYDFYDLSEFQLLATNITDKSLLFIDSDSGAKIQLIIYRTFKSIDDIFSSFDFTVCMGALDCSTEEFTLHPEFMKHNSQKVLRFNDGTAYPIISALRVAKYVDKGYTISKAQFLRIMTRIMSLNLETWDDVANHFGGMYGMELADIFKDEAEFSLDRLLDILDNMSNSGDDVFFNPQSKMNNDKATSAKSIFEMYPQYKPKTYEQIDGYYKVVNKTDSPDVFQSIYKKEFLYPLNEVINGGKCGIFVYEGYNVLSGCYSVTGDDKAIIEIVSLNNNAVHDFTHVTIHGDAKVGKVFNSRKEFIDYCIQQNLGD